MNKTIFALLMTACLTSAMATQPVNQEKATQGVKSMENGLKIEDVVVGTGDEAKKGNTVEVHYTGTLLDGTKFDSSKDRGETFSFTVGQGRVIKGWDEGIPGMKVGGKRILTIPADMAYGSRGAGAIIKPNSPLKFEVELISIKG
ncbi:FKBP-type peptidyl-prolyl cis-trans isomerase [Candidatus Paracaedibacter symbiosus]|uniref:FKBP-type peptidyl-prolyl cis-trans isomerase n=1 Tax=Candidatus Paracaedibacter symbiosus TaxID=244582 RepID=UPI000ABE4E1D|nr:FKBP-type peptidyl-prolyl cis-trans isomerase [Candidatus Paracaedibacter symbiosus]